MDAQRQDHFAQWEEKLSKAQEAAEEANVAHRAEKEAAELAATEAAAAAAGEAPIVVVVCTLQDWLPDVSCYASHTSTPDRLLLASSLSHHAVGSARHQHTGISKLCCAGAEEHAADLERQLADAVGHVAELGACIIAMRAEAESHERRLGEQAARAEAAEHEGVVLQEELAALQSQLVTHAATIAQQVGALEGEALRACCDHVVQRKILM
jgi:hypothetical protein